MEFEHPGQEQAPEQCAEHPHRQQEGRTQRHGSTCGSSDIVDLEMRDLLDTQAHAISDPQCRLVLDARRWLWQACGFLHAQNVGQLARITDDQCLTDLAGSLSP
jgi:hypothetical protein|tara:strand:+ start:312 stop:623 length:312 start_codon:yes stop_codon:yes gene_type:complete